MPARSRPANGFSILCRILSSREWNSLAIIALQSLFLKGNFGRDRVGCGPGLSLSRGACGVQEEKEAGNDISKDDDLKQHMVFVIPSAGLQRRSPQFQSRPAVPPPANPLRSRESRLIIPLNLPSASSTGSLFIARSSMSRRASSTGVSSRTVTMLVFMISEAVPARK
jgi:hypothetical protein